MDYGVNGQVMMMATKPGAFVTEILQPDVAQIEMLEMEIEALNVELEEEKKLAKMKQVECEKHVNELKTVERNLSDCRNELSTSAKELEATCKEVVQKKTVLETLQAELRHSQGLIEQSKRDRQRTEQARTQMSGHAGQVVEELLATIKEREKELAECRSHNEKLNKLHEDYKASSTNQMADYDQEFREQQADLMIKLERSEKEMRNLRVASAREKKEINELRRHIRSITQDSGGRDDEIKNLEQHLTSRDLKIERLSRDLEDLQIKAKKVPGLARQVARYEADVVQWTTQNKKFAEEAEAMKTALSEEKARTARTITELQSKNVDLVRDLANQRAAVKADQSGLTKTTEELQNKNAELASEMRAQSNAWEEEKKKYLARISYFERDQAAMSEELAASQKKLESLEKENIKAIERIARLNDRQLKLGRTATRRERNVEEDDE